MKIEYLFSDTKNKEVLSNYTYVPESKSKSAQSIEVKKDIRNFQGNDKWILSFTIKGENEIVAKHLSIINDDIIKYEPTVLTNESSAYFNRTVYPLINEFERKLRKYIYLRISIFNDGKDDDNKITVEEKSDNDNDDKAKKKTKENKNRMVIFTLEKMEFGELYRSLFTDENVINTFNKRVHSRISSKSFYEKVLSEIDEKTIWDTIKGINEDDCIKNNFLIITDYRNDTMHAHNISYSDYCKQRKMFGNAIDYLDTEIDKILETPSSPETTQTIANALYDKTLPKEFRSTIGNIENLDITDQQMKQLSELADAIKGTLPPQYEMPENTIKMLSNLGEAIKITLPGQYKMPSDVIKALSELSDTIKEPLALRINMSENAMEELKKSVEAIRKVLNNSSQSYSFDGKDAISKNDDDNFLKIEREAKS